MFYKTVLAGPDKGRYCQIVGLGHSQLTDSEALSLVSQADFIMNYLSAEAHQELCRDGRSVAEIAKTWGELISEKRTFFNGHIGDLGHLAVRRCFDDAWNRNIDFDPYLIDAIIGATNTGPEYPSLADFIKQRMGLRSEAMCYDVTEACTSASVAIFDAYCKIVSGACQTVLVVCAEKATSLARYDDWQGSNLFGDASFAVLLQATQDQTQDTFNFFEFNSFPFDGNLEQIKKTDTGFVQNGKKVHLFVIDKVVKALVDSVHKAGIKVADIKHLVFHQPSKKTVSSMKKALLAQWPDFTGIFHESVDIGNASSASFGNLLSKKYHEGHIKPGELVVTCTFGAGLSLAVIGLHLNE